MTRVDGISNSNATDIDIDDVKVPTETSQQYYSTQQPTAPSSEHVFVQQGTHARAPPQIVIQPQFFIQQPPPPPPPLVYAPPPPPPPNHGPTFQPHQYSPAFQPYNPPPSYPPQPIDQQGWKTGLFDCMDDPENAIITLFCPCVTFGQLASTIDLNGVTSCETSGMIYTVVALVIAMPCIVSCTYRTKLRGRFGLIEEPASDCITHFCCECCALCQEYRELNLRGFNPSAGWMKNGNIQSSNCQQQGMVPPPYQTMS